MDAEDLIEGIEPDPLDQVTAIVLAGGRGSRMDGQTPKVLTDIAGKPLISRVVSGLVDSGLTKIHVCLGYGSLQIEQHLNKFKHVGHSNAGDDTSMGERLSKAYENIDTPYALICYGDTLADVQVRRAYRELREKDAAMCLAVTKIRSDFGVVEFQGVHQVRVINEKPTLSYWMNIGYVMCQMWTLLHLKPRDTVVDWINRIAAHDKVIPHYHSGFHYTVNTEKDRAEVSKAFGGE